MLPHAASRHVRRLVRNRQDQAIRIHNSQASPCRETGHFRKRRRTDRRSIRRSGTALAFRQIRKGTFATDEPEYDRLPEWIRPGDWILDVGANVGHYTKRFSELVGTEGRVVAFEPTPATFSLLAANVQLFGQPNVTLINAAASDRTSRVALSIPKFDSGLVNYYEAHLATGQEGGLPVLALAIDSLDFDRRVALVKIDAEDHEAAVLKGMAKLIARDHPVLIVETGSKAVVETLSALGYVPEKLPGSPNFLFKPKA